MKRRTMQRGQATVEFVLVLLIAVAYVGAIIQPNADYASNSMQDVANLGKLSVSAQKISNAVQYVSVSGGGTKQTIEVVVPQGANILCDTDGLEDDSLVFSYTLKSGKGIAACEGDIDDPQISEICTRRITVGPNFSCETPTTDSVIGPGIYRAAIEKDAAGLLSATFEVVG